MAATAFSDSSKKVIGTVKTIDPPGMFSCSVVQPKVSKNLTRMPKGRCTNCLTCRYFMLIPRGLDKRAKLQHWCKPELVL